MKYSEFDFDAAKDVAMAKLRELVSDRWVQDWIFENSIASGKKLGSGKWLIRILVYKKAGVGEVIFEDGASLASEGNGQSIGAAGCVILRESDESDVVEIFRAILDAKNASIDIEHLANFSNFNFEGHGLNRLAFSGGSHS